MSPETLRGDLRHFFPTEVLQLLQLSQATGRLRLERPGEQADVFLDRGRPIFARTSGATVRAGQVLVHRGAASSEAVERALALQKENPGIRIGDLLVGSGDASPADVQNAVREVLRRIVYGVLMWRDGSFHFHPNERIEGEDVTLELDLDRLILEGLKHADEARTEAEAG